MRLLQPLHRFSRIAATLMLVLMSAAITVTAQEGEPDFIPQIGNGIDPSSFPTPDRAPDPTPEPTPEREPTMAPGDAEAQRLEFTGTLDDDNESDSFLLPLIAGQAVVITADATSGDLDPVINLYDPDGDIVANNDDRQFGTLDSALGYIAAISGDYTVEIARYEDTATEGDYRLVIEVGDESILAALEDFTRIDLSGDAQFRDTEHFRIHYTLEGSDRVTTAYLEAVAQAVEEVYTITIVEMGWAAPPGDGVGGGSALYDIYLVDLIGGGEGALGVAAPDSIVGDNPNSPEEEEYAASSYIQVENDFADVSGGTPISLMRATVAHEFHHGVQFGYDVNDSHNWIYEASATYMETIVVPQDQDATGYVYYAYEYPEICFGTIDDPDAGALQYGEWTFLQFLVDEYGAGVPLEWWRNIAKVEGFEALENTLANHGTDIPSMLALYRTKNLARDYDLAPAFEATVWMEDIIGAPGRWTFSGEGIQELGANYFLLDAEPGLYYAGLTNDRAKLQLWAIGVGDGLVTTIPLGRGGTVDTSQYEYTYLMVFNPNYDEEVSDCTYYDYDLDISIGKDTPAEPGRAWDDRYFEPLE